LKENYFAAENGEGSERINSSNTDAMEFCMKELNSFVENEITNIAASSTGLEPFGVAALIWINLQLLERPDLEVPGPTLFTPAAALFAVGS
jgi:hypothetical protein